MQKVKKLKETKKLCMVLSIFAVGIAAGESGAVGNIRLGRMEVHPYVAREDIYDSNIYLSENNAVSSRIGRSVLGLKLKQPLKKRLGLDLDYRSEFLNYDKQSEMNNAVHHLVDLDLKMWFPNGRTFDISNKLQRTSDPNTFEQTERAKRVQNTASVRFEAPLNGRLGFGVHVKRTHHDYVSAAISRRLDRNELLIGSGLRFKIFPKTRIFADYRYGMLDYAKSESKTNDACYHNAGIRITGRLAPKVTGEVSGHVQYRKYKHDIAAASAYTIAGFGVELKWLPVRDSKVIIFARRRAVESSFVNSRFYRSTMCDILFKHTMRKLTLGFGCTVEGIQYPEKTSATLPERKDYIYQLRFNLDYNIRKWLRGGAEYKYRARSSNISGCGYGYRNNVFTIGLTGMF